MGVFLFSLLLLLGLGAEAWADSAVSTLVITTEPADIQAGKSFAITVEAKDANGNRETGFRGTVSFSSTDPLAQLPEDYTFTESDAGIKTFSGVIFNTPGNQTLTAVEITDELTGYWRFDEGTDSTVRDSSRGGRAGVFKGSGAVWDSGAPGIQFPNPNSVKFFGGGLY